MAQSDLSFVFFRGRFPEWYNKLYGHLCAAEVARIRDSFTVPMDKWKKRCAIWATTDSTASLNPRFLTIIWILQRTRNDSFHPFQQRVRWGPILFMLTFKGQILYPGLKDFFFFLWFCHNRLTLSFITVLLGLSVCCQETRVMQTFIWAKGHDVTDTGCKV